jgi:hypothetical protein
MVGKFQISTAGSGETVDKLRTNLQYPQSTPLEKLELQKKTILFEK